MKIIAFDGSPRKNSNSSALLKEFLDKTGSESDIKYYRTDELDIKPCRGCLMCNALKRCAIRKDGWQKIADEILQADVIAFASPIYFHHTTSSMKKLLDRFRSFLKVQITESGIEHLTHDEWNKKFFLFTAHGASTPEDAQPLIELFRFMVDVLGPDNSLEYITAVRLALPGQIKFDEERMKNAYNKLGLPEKLVKDDLIINAEWLATAGRFAESL